MRLTTEKFEIVSQGNVYPVCATEYINGSGELRYRVSYNNNPVSVFGWNEDQNQFILMHDDRNPDMHSEIKNAIIRKLESIQQMKQAA